MKFRTIGERIRFEEYSNNERDYIDCDTYEIVDLDACIDVERFIVE